MLADQFKKFMRDHLARHPRPDWPTGEEAAAMYGCWLAAFKARGVTPAEAEDASRHLAESGGAFPDNHLGYLLGRVEARRKDRDVEAAMRRRAAERAAVEAEKARERELRARWRSLPRDERRAIVEAVKAENPGLARWPLWVLRIAMERAAELSAAGR